MPQAFIIDSHLGQEDGMKFSPIFMPMRLILLFILTFFYTSCLSQTLTGSWYGKADAILDGSHNNYLTELIIKQKGDEVEGIIGYYFRNGYKSLFVRGKYNKKTRQFVIKKFRLLISDLLQLMALIV